MAGYRPINVKAYETGLVQSREEFILPEDAYPTLENAYIWRERIIRKQGYEILGRLQRSITIAAPNNNNNLLQGLEATATLTPGSLDIFGSGGFEWKEPVPPDGTLLRVGGGGTGTVNYSTGVITGPTPPNTGTFSYYPGLPVMGIRTMEENAINEQVTVFFDTTYAYVYNSVSNAFQEFIPGTTFNGTDYQFFWTTNYWTSPLTGIKLMWVTNFNYNQTITDPIYYTDGVTWNSFQGQIDASGNNFILQALCILPFRGALLMFNTVEGPSLGNASTVNYSNRIRWSAIGNPLATNAWRDDIRGKGGFLPIPTNEDIISVGFVRDNLVVFCERSTWQLRYTGRSIAPFQIEKVNSELGCQSTFSQVQFDTSIAAIGNVGIVECDSYETKRIDIKIPDLVFYFSNTNEGPQRIQGVRDFALKLAYWIYPYSGIDSIYPNRRLVYNYENKSWAIFTDSLTALGTYQPTNDLTWENSDVTWEEANFSWIDKPNLTPIVLGGNQQGYLEEIGGSIEGGQTSNDESLFIKNITGFGITPSSTSVQVVSPNHNLQSGNIIQIVDILPSDPFYNYLNNGIFQVSIIDTNTFSINIYDFQTGYYTLPGLAPSGTYLGVGQIKVRDNFVITSKKFNYMDDGQTFQLGWVDVLTDITENGFITMNIYADYNDSESTNAYPLNVTNDSFFNSVFPTNVSSSAYVGGSGGTKIWNRVVCPTNSNFITIQYTLNNEQMQNDSQESDVQIDAQIIYARPGGRQRTTI